MAKIFQNIVIPLVSLVVFLFIAEVAVRGFHVWQESRSGGSSAKLYFVGDQGRRPRANVQVTHHSPISHRPITVTTGPMGIRRQPSQPLPQGATVVLGDSITMADYIEDGKGWVDQLEGHMGSVFINGGLPDTGTTEHISRFKELDPVFKPSRVFLLWYLNDGRPSWAFAPGLAQSKVFEYSALARFVIFRWNLLKLSQKSEMFGWINRFQEGGWATNSHEAKALVQDAKFDWGFAWHEENWQITRQNLQILKELVGDRPMAMAIAPVVVQVEGGLEAYPQKRFLQLCQELQIPCYDLLPVFGFQPGNFWDQCHWNDRGNSAVAAALSGWLKEIGW